MTYEGKWSLWLRWAGANAFGELFGLGITFAFIALITIRLGDQQSALAILAAFLASVVCGVIEATLVGLSQWWAMHPWFPAISRRAWWLGTLAGALVAYVLGYLPSTLMSLGESTSQAPAAEPAQWIVLLFAAGLGLAAGAVLSFAQWFALRKRVQGSRLWIPANMLAWMAGMPLIFWGIDAAQKGQAIHETILIIAGTLFLTGLVVGIIHGFFLVKLAVGNNEW